MWKHLFRALSGVTEALMQTESSGGACLKVSAMRKRMSSSRGHGLSRSTASLGRSKPVAMMTSSVILAMASWTCMRVCTNSEG